MKTNLMDGFNGNILYRFMVFLVISIYSCKLSLQIHTDKIFCNGITSKKQIYFTNSVRNQQQCKLSIKKFNKNICQLRLDFVYFALSQPRSVNNNSFTCLDDTFSVTVDSEMQSNLPVLCGENFGQHIYVSIPRRTKTEIAAVLEIKLKNNLTESYNKSKWKIKITQLSYQQDSVSNLNENINSSSKHRKAPDITAPVGCLQYFTTPKGVFKSFNFNQGKGPYIGNTKYSICFKRFPNSSGIKFRTVSFQLPYNNNVENYTDRDCDTKLDNFDYIDDYLYVPNGITNDELQASKYCNDVLTPNSTVFSRISGPLQVYFNSGNTLSDVKDTHVGFKIKYFIID